MKSGIGSVGAAPSVDPVDAVFVIGTGSKNDNEELRYALRNVARNCPFVRNVYISGECPEWVNRDVVIHLPWRDRFRFAKDSNIIDKLVHACEAPGIASRILLCSDDQFQTRVCTWDDFAPKWLREYDSGDGWYEDRKRTWHSRLHRTLERERLRRIAYGLGEGRIYYWEPHIYSQIDRDSFLRFAEWSDYEHRDDTIIYTGYYNFIGQRGEHVSDHTFIWSGYKWDKPPTHIAYTDDGFGAAMEYLRTAFPEPCRFERPVSGGKAKPRTAAQPAQPTQPAQPVLRPAASRPAVPQAPASPAQAGPAAGYEGRVAEALARAGSDCASRPGLVSEYASQLERIAGRPSRVAVAGAAGVGDAAALRTLLPEADVYSVGADGHAVRGVVSVPGDGYAIDVWKGLPSDFDLVVVRGPCALGDMVRGISAFAPHLATGGVLLFADIGSESDAEAMARILRGSVLRRIPAAGGGDAWAVVYSRPVA